MVQPHSWTLDPEPCTLNQVSEPEAEASTTLDPTTTTPEPTTSTNSTLEAATISTTPDLTASIEEGPEGGGKTDTENQGAPTDAGAKASATGEPAASTKEGEKGPEGGEKPAGTTSERPAASNQV